MIGLSKFLLYHSHSVTLGSEFCLTRQGFSTYFIMAPCMLNYPCCLSFVTCVHSCLLSVYSVILLTIAWQHTSSCTSIFFTLLCNQYQFKYLYPHIMFFSLLINYVIIRLFISSYVIQLILACYFLSISLLLAH